MKTKYLILIFVMYSYLLPNLFSENIYYDSENEENNIFPCRSSLPSPLCSRRLCRRQIAGRQRKRKRSFPSR